MPLAAQLTLSDQRKTRRPHLSEGSPFWVLGTMVARCTRGGLARALRRKTPSSASSAETLRRKMLSSASSPAQNGFECVVKSRTRPGFAPGIPHSTRFCAGGTRAIPHSTRFWVAYRLLVSPIPPRVAGLAPARVAGRHPEPTTSYLTMPPSPPRWPPLSSSSPARRPPRSAAPGPARASPAPPAWTRR